uniref:t-SNARE coiled-coil homology domain-containing protein n=1 Tax=Steinernema glaseri TaxID=37863 RepID=A0A1I8AJA1_9BILA
MNGLEKLISTPIEPPEDGEQQAKYFEYKEIAIRDAKVTLGGAIEAVERTMRTYKQVFMDLNEDEQIKDQDKLDEMIEKSKQMIDAALERITDVKRVAIRLSLKKEKTKPISNGSHFYDPNNNRNSNPPSERNDRRSPGQGVKEAIQTC